MEDTIKVLEEKRTLIKARLSEVDMKLLSLQDESDQVTEDALIKKRGMFKEMLSDVTRDLQELTGLVIMPDDLSYNENKYKANSTDTSIRCTSGSHKPLQLPTLDVRQNTSFEINDFIDVYESRLFACQIGSNEWPRLLLNVTRERRFIVDEM